MRAPFQGTKTKRGYWRVRVAYKDEFGRNKVKTFERKSLIDAQTEGRMFLALHGRQAKPAPIIGTVSEILDLVDRKIWAKSTPAHRLNRNVYRKKWEKLFGDCPVDQLTTPMVTAGMLELCEGKSSSTIAKTRAALNEAFAYAISDLGWVERNPVPGARAPKATRSTRQYAPMTQEEYERMRDLAEPRIKIIIVLCGECGLREIEALRARPEDLFTLHDQWLLSIPKSKTRAGVRSVPIPDFAAKMLDQRPDNEWEHNTTPLDHIQKWWRKHSKTRMYDLRGWRSDEWRRMGINDQLRTYLLGHTKPSFTQSVYETLTDADVLKSFK